MNEPQLLDLPAHERKTDSAWTSDLQPHVGGNPVGDASRPTTQRQPLILVVDDTPETRRLMRRILERDHLRVVEAATGEEALKAIARFRPALVVLDLRLPGIDGTEVARRIRAHPDPAIATTVLLACSASVQPEVQAAALEAGCDSFEGKPFDIAAFAPTIRALISRRTSG